MLEFLRSFIKRIFGSWTDPGSIYLQKPSSETEIFLEGEEWTNRKEKEVVRWVLENTPRKPREIWITAFEEVVSENTFDLLNEKSREEEDFTFKLEYNEDNREFALDCYDDSVEHVAFLDAQEKAIAARYENLMQYIWIPREKIRELVQSFDWLEEDMLDVTE